ncbi:hypothetical protein ACFWF9_37235 [Streptomyces roseolus]|uniref:hypothetical protein n=1 Tax=Streptomyces roseolus TaxID=67358 RepID=UPI0036626D2A
MAGRGKTVFTLATDLEKVKMIFALAAEQTNWKKSSWGIIAEIELDGWKWIVKAVDGAPAFIDGGYNPVTGDVEWSGPDGNWLQTEAIVEAVMTHYRD